MARRRLFEDYIETYDNDDLITTSVTDDEQKDSPFCLYITLDVFREARKSEKDFENAMLLFEKKIRHIAENCVALKSIDKFLYKTQREFYGSVTTERIGSITVYKQRDDERNFQNFYKLECFIYFTPADEFSWRDTWYLYKFFNYVYSINGNVHQNGREIGVLKIENGFPLDNQDWDSWGSDLELSKNSFDMHADELYELGCFMYPDMTYEDFLKAFKTNGFEFILRRYLSGDKNEYEASHKDLMEYVKYVGHFNKTGDAAGLPSYIRDKHPVAGCATFIEPFGNKAFSVSSPWSSLQKDAKLTEFCNTHGCSVYLVSGKISDMIDDEVVCLYDGIYYPPSEKVGEVQIITETSGHEQGLCSKEIALSCFMSPEEADKLCLEFFGPDEDDEYYDENDDEFFDENED